MNVNWQERRTEPALPGISARIVHTNGKIGKWAFRRLYTGCVSPVVNSTCSERPAYSPYPANQAIGIIGFGIKPGNA